MDKTTVIEASIVECISHRTQEADDIKVVHVASKKVINGRDEGQREERLCGSGPGFNKSESENGPCDHNIVSTRRDASRRVLNTS